MSQLSATGDSDAFKVSDANTLTENNNADKVNFKRKLFAVVVSVIILLNVMVIWYPRPPISSVSNNIYNLTELPSYPYTLSVSFRDWFEQLNLAIKLWNILDDNYRARIDHFYTMLSNKLLVKVMQSQTNYHPSKITLVSKVSVSADPYTELRDAARELSESIEKLEHLRLVECLFRESVNKVYFVSKKAPYSTPSTTILQKTPIIRIFAIIVGILIGLKIADLRIHIDKTTSKSCVQNEKYTDHHCDPDRINNRPQFLDHNDQISLIPESMLSQVEVLICDCTGREYWNPEHDILLRIPEGAIPPGIIAHLKVAVTLYGPFHFPEGSCPISPILWLCFKESISLKKPIELILPHYLTDLDKNDTMEFGIKFMKADHNQKPINEYQSNKFIFESSETPLHFIKKGKQGYCTVPLYHCCFLCIGSENPISQEFALKAGYCFWYIEKPYTSATNRDVLYLCATFFLPTCIKAIKSQFTERDGYHLQDPKFFKFKRPADGLSSVPHLFIDVKQDGVDIAANPTSKTIKASQINFWELTMDKLQLMHEERMYPPKVQLTLQAKVNSGTTVSIQVQGSRDDDDLDMQIMLPLGMNNLHSQSQVVCENSGQTEWLQHKDGIKPELRDLIKELYTKVAIKWEDIGILLGLDPGVLENIKANDQNSKPENRLREMLKLWLKVVNPQPTWSAIVDALQSLGEDTLAKNLKEKYLYTAS